MSVDRNLFIGPYLKVTNVVGTQDKEISTCLTKGCSNNGKEMNVRYCPACGAQTVGKTVKVKVELDPLVYLEAVNASGKESWYTDFSMPIASLGRKSPRTSILFGEKSAATTFGTWTDMDKNENVEIEMPSQAEQEEGILKFKEAYAKEIEQLKAMGFGVEVKYGIVHYLS